jgi:hypoxanthine phosphoribosyltransferase
MKKRPRKSVNKSAPAKRAGSKRVLSVKQASSAVLRKRASRHVSAAPPGDRLRVVFTRKQIQRRVSQLAGQINRDLSGKTVHVIGVLENCFLFMADLVRELHVPVICHFLKTEISDSFQGEVALRHILYTPRVDVAGKEVLLVDGILQSGITLDHLLRLLSGQNANSVRTAVLIDKPDERKVNLPIDYIGFKSQEKFLVGYGLGYQERYRNLPDIATRT